MEGRSRFFLFWLAFLLCIYTASCPPTPKAVRGTVYIPGGTTMAPSGLIVYINNTNLSQVSYTETYGPPSQPGRYSASLNASAGDRILVRSWNATHYGESYGIMEGTSATINLELNITRGSEPNVTILYPSDGTSFEAGQKLNVTAYLNLRGANGMSCSAELSFANGGVFTLFPGENNVISLGNINLHNSALVSWNLTAYALGATGLTVGVRCFSDTAYLEGNAQKSLSGLFVIDTILPNITIVAPLNNSRQDSPVSFTYNVTDGTAIDSCSLIVNGMVLNTHFLVERNALDTFTMALGTKQNLWSINCTDMAGNIGSSGLHNLTINSVPMISRIEADDPINLLAAANRTVYCNGSAYDGDGYPDIISVNATLYKSGYLTGIDNATAHYSNTSCSLFNHAGNSVDFSCSFDLAYYARNGTWLCNATVLDATGSRNATLDAATVSELLAIGTSPTIIDYGALRIKEESSDFTITVANYGNVALDLLLYGYAVTDSDNLALNCSSGTIGVNWERFDLAYGTNYAAMTSLQGSASPNSVNFDLSPTNGESVSEKDIYWKLRIPEYTGGECKGKIVFTAFLQ